MQITLLTLQNRLHFGSAELGICLPTCHSSVTTVLRAVRITVWSGQVDLLPAASVVKIPRSVVMGLLRNDTDAQMWISFQYYDEHAVYIFSFHQHIESTVRPKSFH